MSFITGIVFITGLLLAGSEGPHFPYINFAGAALFCMVPVLARRMKIVS